MSSATPKFIADVMLGRLAKWLRLVGYDTVYDRKAQSAMLLRRAGTEGRILLTRNTRLPPRRAPPAYLLIDSDEFRAQLRQVFDALGIEPPALPLHRCSRCNLPLEPLSKAMARPQVPPYVWKTQDRFSRCPRCRRIYWAATHVDRMLRELDRVQGTAT
jgi:uncharacterized protein with PIN domain